MPNFKRIFKAPGVPFTPIIAIICCVVLLSRLQLITWIGFLVWLIIGLLIYFVYGRKHSMLQNEETSEDSDKAV